MSIADLCPAPGTRGTVRTRLRRLTGPAQGRERSFPLEVLLIGLTTYWGLTLMFGGDTFASSASYRNIARIPEIYWACLFLALSCAPIAALVLGWVWVRLLGLLGNTFVWSALGLGFFTANPHGTGGVYSLISLAAAWAFLRVAWDTLDRLGFLARAYWTRRRAGK
jgi:hypothetical protein